MPSFYTIRRKA